MIGDNIPAPALDNVVTRFCNETNPVEDFLSGAGVGSDVDVDADAGAGSDVSVDVDVDVDVGAVTDGAGKEED